MIKLCYYIVLHQIEAASMFPMFSQPGSRGLKGLRQAEAVGGQVACTFGLDCVLIKASSCPSESAAVLQSPGLHPCSVYWVTLPQSVLNERSSIIDGTAEGHRSGPRPSPPLAAQTLLHSIHTLNILAGA